MPIYPSIRKSFRRVMGGFNAALTHVRRISKWRPLSLLHTEAIPDVWHRGSTSPH